jgi:hypothetical protein
MLPAHAKTPQRMRRGKKGFAAARHFAEDAGSKLR